jgi:hypothetical protein
MVASSKLLSVLALAISAAAVPLEKRYDGPGIILVNKGSGPQELFFYRNAWDGVGTAGPRYGKDHEPNPPTLQPGDEKFVPLDMAFKGRVQRGTEQPATWAEFQISADNANPPPGSKPVLDGNDKAAHGDISVQQGNDGPVTIKSRTTGKVGGFTEDYITGAWDSALARNDAGLWGVNNSIRQKDGKNALSSTMGNWDMKMNNDTVDWYISKGADKTKFYFHNGVKGPSDKGVDDVSSADNQLEVTFY